jgi:transcription antitermination protein NusB
MGKLPHFTAISTRSQPIEGGNNNRSFLFQGGGMSQQWIKKVSCLQIEETKFWFGRSSVLGHCWLMGKRREARERAVQFLFQHDLNAPENLELALNQFWDSQRAASIAEEKGVATWGERAESAPPTADEAAVRLFADPLIRGTLQHRDDIDTVIRKHTKNWELHRIAAVDRNILRLALYEMLHRDDIPPVVSINEAVDIAKKFSTQDSGKFVNGILDKVKGELMRPARIVK